MYITGRYQTLSVQISYTLFLIVESYTVLYVFGHVEMTTFNFRTQSKKVYISVLPLLSCIIKHVIYTTC